MAPVEFGRFEEEPVFVVDPVSMNCPEVVNASACSPEAIKENDVNCVTAPPTLTDVLAVSLSAGSIFSLGNGNSKIFRMEFSSFASPSLHETSNASSSLFSDARVGNVAGIAAVSSLSANCVRFTIIFGCSTRVRMALTIELLIRLHFVLLSYFFAMSSIVLIAMVGLLVRAAIAPSSVVCICEDKSRSSFLCKRKLSQTIFCTSNSACNAFQHCSIHSDAMALTL
mmetsp:Transcript_82491/g.129887  ORF Transcript_82491/g.129887 Transcript_82491/m.129887 type:complete len:226 (+) Transcript_82491:144-821(+)